MCTYLYMCIYKTINHKCSSLCMHCITGQFLPYSGMCDIQNTCHHSILSISRHELSVSNCSLFQPISIVLMNLNFLLHVTLPCSYEESPMHVCMSLSSQLHSFVCKRQHSKHSAPKGNSLAAWIFTSSMVPTLFMYLSLIGRNLAQFAR